MLAPSLLLATVGVLDHRGGGGRGRLGWCSTSIPMGALLLGTIIASTDAAAVFFLLRTGGLRLQHRVGATLEIESGTNDPIAVFLVIVLTEFILAGGSMAGLGARARARHGGDARRRSSASPAASRWWRC